MYYNTYSCLFMLYFICWLAVLAFIVELFVVVVVGCLFLTTQYYMHLNSINYCSCWLFGFLFFSSSSFSNLFFSSHLPFSICTISTIHTNTYIKRYSFLLSSYEYTDNLCNFFSLFGSKYNVRQSISYCFVHACML